MAGVPSAAASKVLLLTPNFVKHAHSAGTIVAAPGEVDTAKLMKEIASQNRSRTPIFTIDIHSDNEHVATGGNDCFVRLWSLSAILSDSIFTNPDLPRQLFAGKRHDGTVMCVRWGPGNRSLLASGADDGSVIVWKLLKRPPPVTNPPPEQSLMDPKSPFAVQKENFVDNMAFVQKLPSLNSDVIDISWSHDTKYLAACSLDNTVVVWSVPAFTRLAVCSHKSYVKGIAFDPAGKYLISQSDDGSSILWGTKNWKAVNKITHPFVHGSSSAGTSVLRPSWSPDGELVACAGAISEGVHVSAVLRRKLWGMVRSTLNLVGHKSAVCVAKFSPVSYMYGEKRVNILALGGLDGKISLWAMRETPILVLEKLFDSEITDMSWSVDGKTLMACSQEGRVGGMWVADVAKCLLGDGATSLSRASTKDYVKKKYVDPPQETTDPQAAPAILTPKTLLKSPKEPSSDTKTVLSPTRITPIPIIPQQLEPPKPKEEPKPPQAGEEKKRIELGDLNLPPIKSQPKRQKIHAPAHPQVNGVWAFSSGKIDASTGLLTLYADHKLYNNDRKVSIGPGIPEIVAATDKYVAWTTNGYSAPPYFAVYDNQKNEFAIKGLILESAATQMRIRLAIAAVLTKSASLYVYDLDSRRQLFSQSVEEIVAIHQNIDIVLGPPPVGRETDRFSLILRSPMIEYLYSSTLAGFCCPPLSFKNDDF